MAVVFGRSSIAQRCYVPSENHVNKNNLNIWVSLFFSDIGATAYGNKNRVFVADVSHI